jgi:hypothetical protein
VSRSGPSRLDQHDWFNLRLRPEANGFRHRINEATAADFAEGKSNETLHWYSTAVGSSAKGKEILRDANTVRTHRSRADEEPREVRTNSQQSRSQSEP